MNTTLIPTTRRAGFNLVAGLTLLAGPPLLASPQGHPGHSHAHQRAWCANVVLPQSSVFHVHPNASRVEISGVTAKVLLVDGVAKTTLLIDLTNPGSGPAEAELLLPVPDGAAVSGFDFEGASESSTAELLPKDAALATYELIVAKLKDPALLEFVGSSLVRSSVFPVPAGGTQRVQLVYEHVLPTEGPRWDYELPRSESFAAHVPWTVDVEVRSQAALGDVYSPTHDLETLSSGAHRALLRSRGPLTSGSLRLSVLQANGPVATTLFMSANPDGPGGWFMLLAGVGVTPEKTDSPPREVTIVIDRSGSMGGEKFDQAIAAAGQVVEGLEFGEAVQIIDYAAGVESFAAAPVVKTKANIDAIRAYLASLTATGGTNLDGALQLALAPAPTDGFLPVVLFLTDGLPTEGETREHVIRERALESNVHGRRVFTFGVGHDVNAPLLDAVATRSRGRATYVAPGADVEVAIGGVFEDLAGPIVTDLAFEVTDTGSQPNVRLVRDIYPAVLPDLYEDDRLLLLGRYTAADRGKLRLRGTKAGKPMKIEVAYDFEDAKPRNEFVRRLWAMRRIAALEDELRTKGADPSALATLQGDPRFAEIIDEMIALATDHGVLTDSTAFLALEGTALGDATAIVAAANDSVMLNNVKRTGVEGVSCQENIGINRGQGWVNGANSLFDASGQRVETNTVQTIQGRTYFRRGQRWVDGRIALDEKASVEPDRILTFGSAEHVALIANFAAQGCSGRLALEGEILLELEGQTILIRPAGAAEPEKLEAETPEEASEPEAASTAKSTPSYGN